MTDSNVQWSHVSRGVRQVFKDNSPLRRRRAKYSHPNARDFEPIAAFSHKSIDFSRSAVEIALWRVNCTNKSQLRLNSPSALVLMRV
jgi:hypothetical protein